MRLNYILGILLTIFLSAGLASADGVYVFGHDSVNGQCLGAQIVTATVTTTNPSTGAGTIEFKLHKGNDPLFTGYFTQGNNVNWLGWLSDVGIPDYCFDSSEIGNKAALNAEVVSHNGPSAWTVTNNGKPSSVPGFPKKICFEYSDAGNDHACTDVKFSVDHVPTDAQINAAYNNVPNPCILIAHVQFGNNKFNNQGSSWYDNSILKTPPTPKLSIVKQVSSDGATWHDDTITIVAGSNVYYKFIVTNNGDADLSGITLTDNPSLAFKDTIPTTLAKGGSFTVTAGPITAVTGEQTDTATAKGTYNGQTLIVTDTATYIGTKITQVPEFPSIVLPVAAILGIIFISQRRGKEN